MGNLRLRLLVVLVVTVQHLQFQGRPQRMLVVAAVAVGLLSAQGVQAVVATEDLGQPQTLRVEQQTPVVVAVGVCLMVLAAQAAPVS
jgi:hypothetical protein